jgi:hypothetical protein
MAKAAKTTRAISKASRVAEVPACFSDVWSSDGEVQGAAYRELMRLSDEPVEWAYAVWDDVLEHLSDKNNRSRSIASQLLCNLAKSDPDDRMKKSFARLFAVTGDEKFVTARHCLQSLWKTGCVGRSQQKRLLGALEKFFDDCLTHKNWSLIRYDIVQSIRELYLATGDEALRGKAMTLIDSEADLKYRKKYSSLWPKGK